MSKSQSCGLSGQKEPVCCSPLVSCTCQAQESSITDFYTKSSKLWFLRCSSGLDLSDGEIVLLLGQLFRGVVLLPVNICVSNAI